MAFILPAYHAPDFSKQAFIEAPNAALSTVTTDGVAPEGFHSTSIYPEYFKISGEWRLLEESRMDCAVCLIGGALEAVEPRKLKRGDVLVIGRTENGSEGIYLNAKGFEEASSSSDQFAFRSGRSRETAFSMDYDNLYGLLEHDREQGNIVWVMGPAFAFDYDARRAMQLLIEGGYVSALLAGNALATHDLEAGYKKTALGQDIYTQRSMPNGHYNHLDTINAVRKAGSIAAFIEEGNVSDGIMYALTKHSVPYVLTGSIRDDGPLPEVIASAYEGQDRMRSYLRKATAVICLATQLHTIAAGNMTPSFRVVGGRVRPLYIYTVDISEFVTNKLADRGSLSAISMVTNVQDFIVNVAKGVGVLR